MGIVRKYQRFGRPRDMTIKINNQSNLEWLSKRNRIKEDMNKEDKETKTVLDKMFNELLEDAYKTYQSEAYIKVIQQVAKQINGEKE